MSAPPSPHVSQSAIQYRKKDRPPALDIPDEERKALSDGEIGYQHTIDNGGMSRMPHQPSVQISLVEEETSMDQDYPVSRSTSTSSLDPYYFGLQSPSDSPVPPLPPGPVHFSTTPDQRQVYEPVTPAKDPANIDRRGLVGVGELTTPRWAREGPNNEGDLGAGAESYDVLIPEDVGQDEPDSPWTIEAVDGEASEKDDSFEQVLEPKPLNRPLRTRPSITDESGGEEILYPRKHQVSIPDVTLKSQPESTEDVDSTGLSYSSAPPEPTSPPSAFSQSARRAKKRTSDEFEMDQFGTLVSKRHGSSHATKSKEDKASSRKHRSLNVGSTSNSTSNRDTKGKEKRRESVGLMINSNTKPSSVTAKSGERHVRQTSTSSSSSNHADNHHQRRVHNTDFSHLPPSPSSSSIQQFLRHTASSGSSHTPPLSSASKDNLHSSPNVAHSLLRGTQEGWSGLDDEATAEALRKLDGLSSKSARARASVGSFGRPSSSSRPGTPAGKNGDQWEGVITAESNKSKHTSHIQATPKDHRYSTGVGDGLVESVSNNATTLSNDEQPGGIATEKTPKRTGTSSARSSFTPKRGSTSSTTYTSTPSSRDSASMSTTTSMTSISVTSGRHSSGKVRRNSAGSDISNSSDATSFKDRVASFAVSGDSLENDSVPPVPPLPKDLSSYRSPPATSISLTFPSGQPLSEDKEKRPSYDSDLDRTHSLEIPSLTSPPPIASSPLSQAHRSSQHYSSGYPSMASAPESNPVVLKTPSKKWSFSSALNLKLSSSPSSSQKSGGFPLSPRAVTFGQQLRKSTSKDQNNPGSSKNTWEPKQPDAMLSVGSLTSLSSVGSVRTPGLAPVASKTPDRGAVPSRSGTGSSGSTGHTTSQLAAPQPGPLSPSTSVRRGQSKRLTPSSIPFFRRSSSQSMQLPSSNTFATSSSPTLSSGNMSSTQVRQTQNASPHNNSHSTSVPGSAHKKSSVLSLGLPSLLKSSSRRSLHAESKEASREMQRVKDAAKDAEKEKGRQEKLERERHKKEDKDRSESRISVLMGGRKRGKTLSSTDPRKPKSPVNLPPMQMSALEPATAQRVARLKSSTVPSSNIQPGVTRTPSSTSRLTSQTVSSMQKQSDTSLRTRNQLPTIAGSPSVSINGTHSSQNTKEGKEPPLSLLNSASSHPKETPTKIPRISSRTSTAASPSTLANRRMSVNVAGVTSSTNPSPTNLSTNEFGIMETTEIPGVKTVGPIRHSSIRGSPSTSTPRVPRQASATASTSNNILHRKGNRDSMSFTGLRKASTGSVASVSTPATSNEQPQSSHHRFSALSPSKGLKLLSPKISLPTTRSSNSSNQNIHQAMGSPSSSRQSLSTPSPVPSSVDEEELLGDEEMLHYIRRQQAKKLAAGATQEDLDDLLRFPEPLPPGTPSSPSAVLRSFSQYLSEYERKEILDYPSIYCYGANSKKKMAVLENSTNNYGYDDERGDYLVVNKDHLAFRYEVVDTLGKGSFGQVLHCRDYCTGESMAIKIIRNKKRFHHQALVEIKILDNLRKWDSDEKHHVIKMTEHFYFRNHLCIAMELLSINLYELIKANGFVGFTTALIRRFTSQMLLSLSLMRHHRIVHCDLKPENVLLRHPAKSAIKVIDFGSSCFEHEKIYTYIQSRFYRSPEVILGMNYHMAIDMWSLGCILAELYTGFPIFPGENEQEQLSCIMEVLGIPDKEFVNRSSRKKLFFDPNGAPRAVINSKGRRRRPGTKTLAQVLRCNEEEFVDFISKCLVWDPERRIKPQAAMRHPFITAGRRPRPPPSTTKTSLSASSLSNGRNKALNETPKKSLISAPTPLTARSSRTTAASGPTTPNNVSHASTLGSSSRSYRAPQPQGLSSYHSSRTLSGFVSTATK